VPDQQLPPDHEPPSVQERLYPGLTCFCCGHANPKGLHLRSYQDGDAVVGTFRPWPEHDNGAGFLNGGVIATVLDCHSFAAVMVEADRQGWEPLGGAPLPFVTAGIELRYLRPTPLYEPSGLWARLRSASADEVVAEAEVRWDGKPRAAAVTTWRRWRPR